MKFGLTIFGTVETAVPGEPAMAPVELGQALQEREFESLFLAEHTHVPVGGTPYPGPESDTVPNYFYSMYDPFVALSAVAATCPRLTVGTGVTLVAQRDPIVLAKEVATLDHLTGGRFVLGIGAGWNRTEARNHGVDPARRFEAMREHVEAMKLIWTSEKASYHGEHVAFAPLHSRPKPVQRPYPPIFLGGWAPAAMQRVIDLADGWLAPNIWNLDQVAEGYARLRRMAAEQDRPEPRLMVILRDADPRRLAEAAELKPDRVLFYTDPRPAGDMRRLLDEWAAAVAPYR